MIAVGSLFAGIGGLELGLERTGGFVTKWQVECDDYCNRVLERHWPDVRRYRDVRDVGMHNLEPVDLICGGFPCQDVSLAGKRAGLEGQRTTLWGEFARIIGELRPRWVLAENVPGLLSSDAGRFFGNVLRDLAACGYDAEWDCIPASAVGAPHRRDRVFIVAYPNGQWQPQSERLVSNERGWTGNSGEAMAYAESERGMGWRSRPKCTGWHGAYRGCDGAVFSHADRESLGRLAESRGQRGQWAVEPNVGRVADGVPSRVDRLRCLGNAVVPQVAEWVGQQILRAEARELLVEEIRRARGKR